MTDFHAASRVASRQHRQHSTALAPSGGRQLSRRTQKHVFCDRLQKGGGEGRVGVWCVSGGGAWVCLCPTFFTPHGHTKTMFAVMAFSRHKTNSRRSQCELIGSSVRCMPCIHCLHPFGSDFGLSVCAMDTVRQPRWSLPLNCLQ